MANLQTIGLISSDFFGININAVKSSIIEKCTELAGPDYRISGDVLHEYKNEMHYVYFNALPIGEGYTKGMHRYYKVVYSFLLIDRYYFSSNVIDATASYDIANVKEEFKGYLAHLTKLANKS